MAHSKKKHTSHPVKSKAEQKKMAAKQEKIINTGALILGICLIVLIAVIVARGTNFTTSCSDAPAGTTTASVSEFKPGDGATLDNAVATHIAQIEIQNYGTIKLELFGNTAPITVENFVKLAQSGFYNGSTFHRIIKGFMMQGGAPVSGNANDVEKIPGEFRNNGFENNLLHKKGVISMARASSYNSGSSQFFIMHADKTHLDGDYAAFGRVISGIEIVDKICTDATPTDKNGSIATENQPIITSITITNVA